MNLLEMLSREHSRAQRDKIVRYVGTDPKRLAALVNVFLNGPYRITQRAAWPLSYCIQHHPSLVKPHLRKLVHLLGKPGLPDAVKRNTLRLLQFVDITPALQGQAATVCFQLFHNPKEPVAVHVFAMTVLANIAQRQPELKKELSIIIEDRLPYASAGFRARARRVMKQLT